MNRILLIFLCIINGIVASPLSLENRCKGAILGAAVGDALGRITEFIDSTSEIKYKYGSKGLTSFAQFKKHHWVDGKALYTDDTVMAKILLEDALQAKKENHSSQSLMSTYALHCISLLGNDKWKIDPYYPYRAHGPTNEIACENLQTLLKTKFPATITQILKAHAPNPTGFDYQVFKEGGCGSVMRAWPLGLVFYKDLDLVKELAEKQSNITHRHPMARAASVAMAVGTACALQGMSVEQIVKQMINAAKAFETEEKLYKKNIATLPETITYNPALIANNTLSTSDMIAYAYHMAVQGKNPELILGIHNLKQTNYRSPDGFLLGWAADEAVAAAVYVFTRHCDDIKAAIIEGVNTPGDSDSIATLAAALVGAFSGMGTLETFDYSKLENKDQLLALAEQTAQIA